MSEEVDNEVDEKVERIEPPRTFICPVCGEPQKEFIYRSSKRGWAECLACGRFTRTKSIPEEFIKKVPDNWNLPVSMGDETELDEEYDERDRIPFRRLALPHVLVDRVLRKYGVKDRSRDIIVDRCKTAGGMHPSELEKALRSLDTGLSKAAEINYVVEDYFIALQAEEKRAQEFSEGGRSYPTRRGEPGYSSGTYPLEGEQPTGRQLGYDRSLGRPGDRSERGREEPLTMRSLYDILERRERESRAFMERRERDLEDRMRRSTLEDKVGSIGEDISVLATELRNLKENPPVQPQPQGESDYEKMLQHTIGRQDERLKELLDRTDRDRTETKADLKEQREYYEGLIDKQEARFKEDLDKRGTPHDTSGYRDDAVRLAAEGMHELADVARSRGSPFKILIDGIPIILGETGPPPQRERGRPASVADLVGPEYVEG